MHPFTQLSEQLNRRIKITLATLMLAGMVLFLAAQPRGVSASGSQPPTPVPGALTWPPVTTSVTSTAVLINGGFEGGILGWSTWQEDTGKPVHAESLEYVVAPAFSVEKNPVLVRAGESSLHIGRLFDPWHAGLKQFTRVTPGARVKFCAYGQLYASNRDFGHEASWSSLDGHMRVGLADGDVDWSSESITWSTPANPHDGWQEMCVEATSTSGQVSMFTSTNYRGVAAKHLDAWWDTASLTVIGTDAPPLDVLVIVPAAQISGSVFLVVPAKLYVGSVITLTAGQPLTTTLSGVALSALLTPTVKTATPLPTPSPTMAATAISLPSPTATATPQPTSVPPTVTPVPPAAVQPPTPLPAQPAPTLEPLTNSTTPDMSGLLGPAALLACGAVAAVALGLRRR